MINTATDPGTKERRREVGTVATIAALTSELNHRTRPVIRTAQN